MIKKEKWVNWSHRIGMFLVISLIVDISWHYIMTPDYGLIHDFYKESFLGFTGFNLKSIIFALIQTYLWSYIFVGIWYLTEDLCKNKKMNKQ